MIYEVNNAGFAYGSKRIFDDVSFSLEKGQITAILGPNGSGKTTLLRCMIGMYSLNQGKILLNGKDIKSITSRDFWKTVAYVPQAKGTMSSMSVLDSVLLGRSRVLGVFEMPSQEDEKIAHGILESLHIEHLADKPCDKISGGERQMVLIARAMVSSPEIIILDEPESNLDYKNQLIVLQTIRSFASKGITCLFNTHYPEHVLQWADQAILLSDHKTIVGKPNEIVSKEHIKQSFGVESYIQTVNLEGKIYQSIIPLDIVER